MTSIVKELTLPKGYKPGGSLPARRSNKNILIVIIVLIAVIVNIAIIWNHFHTQAIVENNWRMLEQNCFPVDATWDPVKNDYDKLPTQWDCSRDILGKPK